ncbi:MAG TPA: acetate uptake transporter [Gemmatimonadaceae bacterium]|nr:acetate uptake transporter [Gemmatimonadaceae bacterium]
MPDNTHAVAANPLPFGLLCYGVSVFILSGFLWGSLQPQPAVGYALFAGGLGMFLAGIATYRAGNTFATTVLAGYGAFWASTAIYIWFFAGKSPDMNADLAWITFAWGIFTLYMFVASLRTGLPAITLLLALLFILFLFAWLATAFNVGTWALKVAAIAGIVSAADAAIESFREVMASVAPPPPAGV